MPPALKVAPNTEGARAFLRSQEKRLLIDGAWVAAVDGGLFETVDPGTGDMLAQIARGREIDVDAAVGAARKAFERGPWRTMTPIDRARILWAIADLMEAHIDELAELETLDQGKPLFVGRWAEIPGAINQFRYFAGRAMTIEGRTIPTSINYQPQGMEVDAWSLREPVGVVGAIVPWNSPLVLTAMKLAPALAAGCTIVLKPAEDTSLTALRLGELIMQAGLPNGVLNIVTGLGAEAGAALAAHSDVDKIAFTGSTATGRAVLEASKGNLKRVSLELGGKSPVVICKDADMGLAIPGAANAIYFNGGQVCVAGSRIYAHRSVYEELTEGLVAHAKSLQLGHGLSPDTQMGPLVSRKHADKVADYVRAAATGGASVLTGGVRTDHGPAFVSPAVVAGVTADMAIVREEVFGPVVVVQPFDDDDEVVAAANDSIYGLAASVWTTSLSSAHRLSRRIRAGTIWINCHSMYDCSLPIGGTKQSGFGRDSGEQALDNYLEWKTVCAVL